MRIRLATENDAARLADFIVDYWAEGDASAEREEGRTRAHELVLTCARRPEGHAIFLAEDESGVLAYAAVHWIPFPLLHGTECYISDLIVRQAARGQGIGASFWPRWKPKPRQGGAVA